MEGIRTGQKEPIGRDHIQIYRLLFGGVVFELVELEDAVPAVKSWFYGRTEQSLVILDSADTIDNPNDASYIDLGFFVADAANVENIITTRGRAHTGYEQG